MKIGIVVCTNSGADYYNFDHPVEVIHSYLHLNDDIFEDYVDITAEEFYEKIANDPNIDVKTSQPPLGSIIEKYEKLGDLGYDKILVVVISTKLSGIYQSAKLAADMTEGIEVRIVDSKSVSYGELYLVLEAIKLIKKGKDLEEIATSIEALIPNINILVYVDTLKYLVKNGRLSAAKGAIGTMLKVKPILRMDQHEGTLSQFDKVRTSRRALARILEIFETETKDRDILAFIVYTNNKDFAGEVREKILELRLEITVELVPLTPVVGAHAGPGTLGIGYIFK